MLKFKHNETLPQDFRKLQVKSGHAACSSIAAVGAIKNSLFTTGLYHDDELIAFGRVCGDGHLYFLVCDIMIDKKYADSRLSMALIKEIDDYLRLAATKDMKLLAKIDKEQEELFLKLGYKYYDEDFELVMYR